MKVDVGALEALEVADRLPVDLERSLEPLNILQRGAHSGVAGKPDLEKYAGALEVVNTSRGRNHVPRRPCKGVDNELRCGAGDAGTFAGPHLDKAHFTQMQQRLTDRGASDTELTHEVPLGRETVGYGQFSLADHSLEVFCDLVGKLPLFDLNPNHLAYLLYQHTMP